MAAFNLRFDSLLAGMAGLSVVLATASLGRAEVKPPSRAFGSAIGRAEPAATRGRSMRPQTARTRRWLDRSRRSGMKSARCSKPRPRDPDACRSIRKSPRLRDFVRVLRRVDGGGLARSLYVRARRLRLHGLRGTRKVPLPSLQELYTRR